MSVVIISIARNIDNCESNLYKYSDFVSIGELTFTKYKLKFIFGSENCSFTKDELSSGKNIVLTECFDGRIIIGNPFDLTNPKFVKSASGVDVICDAMSYIKEHNIRFNINEESAQLEETKDHLAFVVAQRHYFKNVTNSQ